MQRILRWIVVVALFIIPFIPLYVNNSLYFPFISGKNFLFRIFVEIALVGWVGLWFFDRSARPRATKMTVTLSVFTIIIALADLFGVSVFKSIWSNYERMEGFVTVAHLAGFVLVASTIFTQKLWIRWFAVSLGVATYTALYGVFQLFGAVKINQSGDRLDGNIGNAAYFAIYLVFHIFTALILGIRSRGWGRWLAWITIPLLAIIAYYTGTRGALLGLIAGLGIAALIVAIWGRGYPKMRKISIVTIIALVVIVGGFIAARDSQFVRSSPILNRFAGITLNNLTQTPRFIIWGMALEGVAERPILGWGQENFNYVFNKYYDARLFEQEQWFDRTHNVILDWFIAGGILGLLSYLALFVMMLWVTWRTPSLSFIEKSLITGMVTAYTVHNLFVFDNLTSYIMFFAWFGYIATQELQARYERALISDPKLAKRQEAPPATGLDWTTVGIASAIVLFCLYSIPASAKAYSTGKDLIITMAYQQAQTQDLSRQVQIIHDRYVDLLGRNNFGRSEVSEQAFQSAILVSRFPNLPVEQKNQFLALGERALQQQIERTPNDARYHYFLGSYYNTIGRFPEAAAALTRAVELSPEKISFIIELGSAYLQQEDIPNAMANFRKAYELGPQFSGVKRAYLLSGILTRNAAVEAEIYPLLSGEELVNDGRIWQIYKAYGRTAEARAKLNQIAAANPNLADEVAELLKQL